MKLKRPIGFGIGTPIRMEEEAGNNLNSEQFTTGHAQINPDRLSELLAQVLNERDKIIGADIENTDRLRLLEENRKALTILTGRSTHGFATEKVIYAILIFGAVVLIVLSLLNTFAQLSTEVTVTFAGTALVVQLRLLPKNLAKSADHDIISKRIKHYQ